MPAFTTAHDIQGQTPAAEKRGYQVLVVLSFVLGLAFLWLEFGVAREAFYQGIYTTIALVLFGISGTFLAVLDSVRDHEAAAASKPLKASATLKPQEV